MDTYTPIIHREGEIFVALCPETGTVSQRPIIEEIIANLKKATELYWEEFLLPPQSRCLITTFEVVPVVSH